MSCYGFFLATDPILLGINFCKKNKAYFTGQVWHRCFLYQHSKRVKTSYSFHMSERRFHLSAPAVCFPGWFYVCGISTATFPASPHASFLSAELQVVSWVGVDGQQRSYSIKKNKTEIQTPWLMCSRCLLVLLAKKHHVFYEHPWQK